MSNSYLQTSFIGGEWSQTYQGRMDDPHYRTAMSVCLNAFPTETGAWTRRSGAQFVAFTREGNPGRVLRFDISETNPYVLEFTDNILRFYGFGASSVGLITTNDQQTVTNISTANPTVITTALPHGWATGNTVIFPAVNMTILQNRQFLITVTGANTFSLQDALTGANINGAAFGSFMSATVARVLELQTNYYGNQWQEVISIQAETQSVLVNGQAPQILSMVTAPTAAANATFALTAAELQDGPYLDVIPGSVATPSSSGAVTTLTFSFQTYSSSQAYTVGSYVTDGGGQAYKSLQDNNLNNTPSSSPTWWVAVSSLDPIGPNGFTAADVGRHIRLFVEPPNWAVGTTYSIGAIVTYPGSGNPNNTYWLSLVNSNVGVTPGTSVTNWALVTGSAYAYWTWGKIISTTGTLLTVPSTIGNLTNIADAFNGNTHQTAANSASAATTVTTYPQWQDNTAYAISTNVYYNGFFYQTTVAFAPWSWPTNYSVGNVVEYHGSYYQALVASQGQQPSAAPTIWSNLGVANPSNTNVWVAGAQAQAATIDSFAGAHLGSASQVLQATVFPSTDQRWGVSASTLTFNLWGSSSAPTGAKNGTLLGSQTVTRNNAVTVQNTAFPASTFNYVWVEIISNSMPPYTDNGTHSYTATAYVAEIQFYAPNVAAGGCTVELLGENPFTYGIPIYTWQAGVYSDAAGWPTCGCYFEGRLWLAGAVGNRIDASMSNSILTFSPTGLDGTVADDNGISFTFDADGVNTIFWMAPAQSVQGIVCGTEGGEWVVPDTSPPLTPSNMSAFRATKNNCADVEPVITEHTLCLVQRRQRKVFEYFADVFSGKFTAPNITERARHLTTPFIEEIRYQNELTPTIWARCGDGSLIACTYRRDTLMTSQGPTFYGWHRHQIAGGYPITSITVGPSQLGSLDSLLMVATDPATNYNRVMLLADYFEENTNPQNAFLLDDAVNPTSYAITGVGTQLTINGLWHLNGKTVQVYAAGLDCGLRDNLGTISDFVVSNGSVTVPFGDGLSAGSGAGMFTAAFVQQWPGTSMPLVVGLTYTSQGQLLRPVSPAEAGTRAGPGFGKKRRNNRFAVQVVNTNGLSIGTSFAKLDQVYFRPISGAVPVLMPQLYSGVFQGEVRDDFTYDGQICWQVSRPVPALITAIGGFIDTADI